MIVNTTMKLLIGLCFTLFLANSGFGIRCYVCDSCSSYTKDHLKICGSSVTQCRKLTSGENIVTRECGTTNATVECVAEGVHDAQQDVCTCDGEACNSTGGMKPAAIAVLLFPLLLAKIVYGFL